MSVCTVKCTVYVPCTVYSVCTVYSEDKMEHSTCTAALSMFVCVEKCYKCCFLNLLHVLYSVQCTVMILVPFVTIFFILFPFFCQMHLILFLSYFLLFQFLFLFEFVRFISLFFFCLSYLISRLLSCVIFFDPLKQNVFFL